MSETEAILRHCREINRCNQRGGRMLSVVDLIAAGTMTTELAAYCLAAIGGGASFMVGALPGGAGKTTVMGAMINFVPEGVELVPADGQAAISRGLRDSSQRQCLICHEIGPGPYYAYLWGQDLRDYFDLAEAGHILATNLHADTYEQARDQICRQNEVPEAALRRMNLMLFLSVRGGRRRIEAVWESDGQQSHRLIYEAGNGGLGSSHLVTPTQLGSPEQVIKKLISNGRHTIEDVRAMIVQAG